MSKLLVGGYTGDKGAGSGITVLEDGQVVGTVNADSPSWIARHPELPVLYAVAEIDEGRVQAWSLAEGVPVDKLGSGETGGSEPAHLAVDPTGRFLITANYSGGNISVHRLGPDGEIGERTDLVEHTRHGDHPRQDTAHPHMVRVSGDQILIIDLGGDAIYQYAVTQEGKLELEDVIHAPAGSGPRHAVHVGDRFFVTAELSGEVLVYDREGQLVQALPASRKEGHNQPSELTSNGRYLYVANRGPDSISVFALDADMVRYVTEVATGSWPRHIALAGDDLYVANERSHEVVRMHIDPVTGIPAPAQTIEVPSPTCILP
jgi:6-phosphogluconolactonase